MTCVTARLASMAMGCAMGCAMGWAMGCAMGWALLSLAACSPPPTHGGGGPCQSLSDCKPGLVCGGNGRCTRNLRDLARQTEAPPFTMFDAGADTADAGVAGDAAATPDASRSDGG